MGITASPATEGRPGGFPQMGGYFGNRTTVVAVVTVAVLVFTVVIVVVIIVVVVVVDPSHRKHEIQSSYHTDTLHSLCSDAQQHERLWWPRSRRPRSSGFSMYAAK